MPGHRQGEGARAARGVKCNYVIQTGSSVLTGRRPRSESKGQRRLAGLHGPGITGCSGGKTLSL